MPALVKALNKVDLPTLGKPTIPHFKLMSAPVNEARKCMPWAMARLLAGCCMLVWSVQCGAAEAPSVTVLRDDASCLDAQPLARNWVDPRGDASLEQVVRTADRLFAPAVPGTVQR